MFADVGGQNKMREYEEQPAVEIGSRASPPVFVFFKDRLRWCTADSSYEIVRMVKDENHSIKFPIFK